MSLPDILLAYTFVIIGLAAIAYLYFVMRSRSLGWELSRPRLVRCSSCNRVFLVRRQAPVARCPRCNGVSSAYLSK
ncbi:MAG: hypothetical protein J6X55_04745 [Victivallales bacterium]|nr:hypothetical protein [Victivallales bacterium]